MSVGGGKGRENFSPLPIFSGNVRDNKFFNRAGEGGWCGIVCTYSRAQVLTNIQCFGRLDCHIVKMCFFAGLAIQADCDITGNRFVVAQPAQIFGVGYCAGSVRVGRFYRNNNMVFPWAQNTIGQCFTHGIAVAVGLIDKVVVLDKQHNAAIQSAIGKNNAITTMGRYINISRKSVVPARQMGGVPLVNTAGACAIGKDFLPTSCGYRIETSNARTQRVNLITLGFFVKKSLKFFQFFRVLRRQFSGYCAARSDA